MPRRTLADLLNPNTCRMFAWLGIDPDDPRLVTWANSATNVLLHKGHWWGTVQDYTVLTSDRILTLPPTFDTVEKIAICKWPAALRTEWYSYNPNGPGLLGGLGEHEGLPGTHWMNFGSSVLPRGSACTFKDITPPGAKLILQCDVAADIGQSVLLLGYDNSTPPNWVRTRQPANTGPWLDGEVVSLSTTPGTSSVTTFSKLTGIQKPVTSGQGWLYQGSNAAANLIGHYQYWETNPLYARYHLPFIADNCPVCVDLIGKIAFRPLSNPTDWLLIGNLEAIMYGVAAMRAAEEHRLDEAAILMNGKRDPATGKVLVDGALTLLDEELQHYTGAQVPSVQVGTPGVTFEPLPLII